MLTLNRLKVMLKRSIKQPLNIIMLLILIAVLIIYKNLPAEEKSEYIPVVIYSDDTSQEAEKMVDDLLSRNSIFVFYKASSLDQIYDDIASKKAEMGFYIPEGFMDSCCDMKTLKPIILYRTAVPELQSLAKEEVFSTFFDYGALKILKYKMDSFEEFDNINKEELNTLTDRFFKEYKESDSIFTVEDMSGGKYNTLNSIQPTALPIRKIAGFIILAAGLLGVLSYLYDKEKGLYLRLTTKENLTLRMIHIISTILPVTLVAYITLVISDPSKALSTLGTMVLYGIATWAVAFLFSFIFRKSVVFEKVLPLILVATLIFGNVFFDMSKYNALLQVISRFFLTSYL